MSLESERPRVPADVEKWIVEARQGDREALGRLLEKCRHYLLLVAGNELTPALRAKVAPSDIVQDTLMAAGRDFPRFQGSSEEELLAWLRGILRNNVADVHRQYQTKKRQVAREVPLADAEQVQMLQRPVESPSKEAQAQEEIERMEKALQQLPDNYRQVLELYAKDRLTFVQIAEKMGRTADAVRKLFRRAIEALDQHRDTPHESV